MPVDNFDTVLWTQEGSCYGIFLHCINIKMVLRSEKFRRYMRLCTMHMHMGRRQISVIFWRRAPPYLLNTRDPGFFRARLILRYGLLLLSFVLDSTTILKYYPRRFPSCEHPKRYNRCSIWYCSKFFDVTSFDDFQGGNV